MHFTKPQIVEVFYGVERGSNMKQQEKLKCITWTNKLRTTVISLPNLKLLYCHHVNPSTFKCVYMGSFFLAVICILKACHKCNYLLSQNVSSFQCQALNLKSIVKPIMHRFVLNLFSFFFQIWSGQAIFSHKHGMKPSFVSEVF